MITRHDTTTYYYYYYLKHNATHTHRQLRIAWKLCYIYHTIKYNTNMNERCK